VLALLAVALAAAQIAPAQAECLISLGGVTGPVPSFASFPARIEKRDHPIGVDVRASSMARTYRTQLRGGAKAGPNFAGHFTIASWGCGSACVQWAVIDQNTGKARFEPTIDTIDASSVDPDSSNGEPLVFHRDSRLLIVQGAPHEDETRAGVGFYQWNGGAFGLLKFVPRARACRRS
jgi:hypothetical protein